MQQRITKVWNRKCFIPPLLPSRLHQRTTWFGEGVPVFSKQGVESTSVFLLFSSTIIFALVQCPWCVWIRVCVCVRAQNMCVCAWACACVCPLCVFILKKSMCLQDKDHSQDNTSNIIDNVNSNNDHFVCLGFSDLVFSSVLTFVKPSCIYGSPFLHF